VSPEEVATRFDNRPGYRIGDFGAVGLPVYKVTAIGLTLVKKDLNPIDEFVLRAVRLGLTRPEEVTGFLGLSDRVVTAVIADMITREHLVSSRDADGDLLLLTEKGKRTVAEQEEIRPAEQTIPFTYDAITRKPKYFGDSQLYSSKEMRARGITELRAFPNRGPDLHELDPRSVGDVLALAAGDAHGRVTLLRLTSVERRMLLYCEALALCYRPIRSGPTQIAFAVDGRLSEEYELAFAAKSGIDRNPIFRELSGIPAEVEVPDVLDPDLRKRVTGPKAQKAREEAARARAAVAAAKADLVRSRDNDDNSAATDAVKAREAELNKVIAKHSLAEVRHVEVYEHPELLQDALNDAQKRLLIISPWIRASVVDESFFRKLSELLARGVSVVIGYGLGHDEGEAPRDRDARKRLHDLASRHANLTVRRLGDTHAKVLIKDSKFSVVGSFNWLSFKGDRNRAFREELGYLVAIPERVDDLFARLMHRFSESEDTGPGEQ
jgi:hypothetical protein